VTPERKTSPPVNQLMRTTRSGVGMSKNSPYISSRSSSMYSPSPSAIGWSGATTHNRSRSSASRHFSLQLVPMSRRKTLL
jgi:hypothetical protein